MPFVKLIDADYIFTYTTVDKNVEPLTLEPSIIVAQDTNIQQIIGYNLYNRLMNLVYSEEINDVENSAYKELLNNHIQPALAQWAVYHALPSIQYHLTNKSILSKTTDNATTTGLPELKYLRENTKNYADFYNQRIREVIINNPTAYPEYFQTIGLDRIRPKRTTYFSGWSGTPQNGNKYRNQRNNGYGDPDCFGCDGGGIPLN